VDVLTANGRRIRVLSVAFSGLEEGSGLPQQEAVGSTGCDGWVAPSQADLDNIAGAGFNAVRLAFSWANLEPKPTPSAADGSLRHVYDQRYLAALDDAIDAFTSKGVAVVLDLHQVRWSPAFKDLPVFGHPRGFCQGRGLPDWLYPNGGGLEAMVAAERSFFGGSDPDAVRGMEDTWRFLAGRYASNPLVIGADLLNEPYDLLTAPYPDVSDLSPADLDLAGFYERLGDTVHEVAPTWLLFVEENLSRRTGRFALIRKPDLSNMVLAPHFYQATWDQVGIDRLERYLEKSRTWEVPLWLGESTRYALDPGWASSLTQNLDWYKDREAGWALWSYMPGWFDGSVQPGMVEVVQAGF
jgi:hypothetical protein